MSFPTMCNGTTIILLLHLFLYVKVRLAEEALRDASILPINIPSFSFLCWIML